MSETEKHRCSKRIHQEFHTHLCPRNATVQHADKWYCRQHDPDVELQKQREWWERHLAREFAQKDIQDTAKVLAERLGIKGTAHYVNYGPPSAHGYERVLMIPFDDVVKLLAELKR